jgi:hypothetical protein
MNITKEQFAFIAAHFSVQRGTVKIDNCTSTRYFITSLEDLTEFAYAVRKHWAKGVIRVLGESHALSFFCDIHVIFSVYRHLRSSVPSLDFSLFFDAHIVTKT